MTPECRGARARITYQPNLKCCTFEPFIPNFHVGALLSESKYSRIIEAHIHRKSSSGGVVLPLGLAPDRDYQGRFQARKPRDFGNREDLLCGYFDKEQNQCSIWKYRGAVCTAFFCESSAGRVGETHWKNLGDYLFLFDTFIAEEILAQMGIAPREVSDQLEWLQEPNKTHARSVGGQVRAMKKLWPPEFKDVSAFYKECYKLALGFSRDQVQEAIGEPGARLRQKVGKSRLKFLEKTK
jgi:hypothetical protein